MFGYGNSNFAIAAFIPAYGPKGKRDMVDQKQDAEINSVFKIELTQDITRVSYICLHSC
jgi:hypothetical protein